MTASVVTGGISAALAAVVIAAAVPAIQGYEVGSQQPAVGSRGRA